MKAFIRHFFFWLQSLRRKGVIQREIDEELSFHLEQRTAHNIAAGFASEQAARDARRRFGNFQTIREQCRDASGATLGETTLQDVWFGLRMLRRNPGFALVAILTLAIGIGSNITIFSAMNAVMMRPLPYPNARQLVYLWTESPQQGIKDRASAYGNVQEWRQQNTSFQSIAVFDPTYMTVTGGPEPQQVLGIRASANLFPLLGVAPVMGRTFTADEEAHKAAVVVVSQGLWRRCFGESQDLSSAKLQIDGLSAQVIGVMPDAFQFPNNVAQIWQPIPDLDKQEGRRGTGSWRAIGRLKPQVGVERAQTEMNAIAQRLEMAFPDANKGLGVHLVPFDLQVTGKNVRLAFWILFGAVVLVLLIACANVAGLMLARGLARDREMAIRVAMGAGRMRLIRQMLIESALQALLAGVAGLVFARFGIKAILALAPGLTPSGTIEMDASVMVFAVVISLSTCLLFGLLPALKLSHSDPAKALKGARGTSGGIDASRMRGLMVVVEFGVAVLLLSGAGLLVRSFINVQLVDPGFDAKNVLFVQTIPARYTTPDQWRAFYEAISARIPALPGVDGAGLINDLITLGNPDGLISVEGGTADGSEPQRVAMNSDAVSEGFFQTLKVPLLRGRFFDATDRPGSVPVAVINQAMAHRLWPGQEPIGKRFKPGVPESSEPWLTVVGIVGDMRRQNVETPAAAQIFVPYRQRPARSMNLVVRSKIDAAHLTSVVREEIRSIDKTVPVQQTATLESILTLNSTQRRFQTCMLAAFSAIALLLAAVGIYGLIHQSVVLRTREIGTRVALGAQPGDITRMIVRQGIALAFCGIVIGVLAALGISRVFSGFLFGVTPTDSTTFTAVPLILALVALLASYVPARRAARIDPMVALRYE